VTRRILVSVLAATTVALILLGVPLAVAIGRLYHSQELTRLQREATLAAGAVPDSGLSGPDPVEAPSGARPRTSLGYYTPAGRLVGGVGPPAADQVTSAALQSRVSSGTNGGRFVVAVPIVAGEIINGAVRASTPIGPLHRRIYGTWLAIAALGAVALGAAAAIGRRQARKLATPVTKLAVAMDRLGQGDFTVRIAPTAGGIPELETAGRALDATAENLGDLMQRERAFSADVSHQLRTPLAGLRITLESALLSNHRDPHETLTDAIAELDRLEATIQELLAHARDTSRPREIVDFASVLSQAENRWHSQMAVAGRPLRTKVDAVPPTRASTTAISQIVDVLIANAVHHGQGAVTVHVRRAGPGVAVDVEDGGPGIDQDPEAIFGRGISRGDGHGIGLALARSLAQAEGGQLLLRQARPHPIFTLVLPPDRTPRQPDSADTADPVSVP
jgi:signal transduction histidine kinase